MLTLYAVAASEDRLVADTSNRSEAYVGYFTKWSDGAHDFNFISGLTVTEIYVFKRLSTNSAIEVIRPQIDNFEASYYDAEPTIL